MNLIVKHTVQVSLFVKQVSLFVKHTVQMNLIVKHTVQVNLFVKHTACTNVTQDPALRGSVVPNYGTKNCVLLTKFRL